ncbi:unnamed protein product [Aureobasidium uvarum]|uniref:Uncharacterized protein n=1 Tax=Aureobasidium uvarum TaxID=2773716 RepID=A0A9N8KB09_9PEZI|nr:unnamed protein product [Aureobasidium uvarum]
MQHWNKFTSNAIAVFALIVTAYASISSIPTTSSDNKTFLAPLIETCPPGSTSCGKVPGKYLVLLRQDYTPSAPLSYIATHLHLHPIKEWGLEWIGTDNYIASNVSLYSIDLLRRDLGVEEIDEGCWFQMSLVDVCRDPKLSAEEQKQCDEGKEVVVVDCGETSLLWLTEKEKEDCVEQKRLVSLLEDHGQGEISVKDEL